MHSTSNLIFMGTFVKEFVLRDVMAMRIFILTNFLRKIMRNEELNFFLDRNILRFIDSISVR